jgi:hypothetical protein
MGGPRDPARWWLIGVVLAHLGVSVVHGAAHQTARVFLSTGATVFVAIVIIAGPLVGLAMLRPRPAVGAGIVAATMAASLVFGVVNHFVVASPDHVSHVDPGVRPLFSTTAVLLVVTESLGLGLALPVLRERKTS